MRDAPSTPQALETRKRLLDRRVGKVAETMMRTELSPESQ